MKFKTFQFIVCLLSVLLTSEAIQALTIPSPYFKAHFNNWEWFNPEANPSTGSEIDDKKEDNWGIARIDTIQALDGSTAFYNGQNGEHIYAYFYGLDLAYWNSSTRDYGMQAADSTQDGTPIAGAYMELYLWNKTDPNFEYMFVGDGSGIAETSAGRRTSPTQFTGVTNGGIHLATLQFTYGVSNNTNIVASGQTQNLDNPPTGSGQAFLKVVPGSGILADVLDTNAVIDAMHAFGYYANSALVDPESDLYLSFDIGPYFYDTDHILNVHSDDPLVGAVPEPTTIFLMGSGLLFAGGLGRKKFLKKTH